MDEQIRFPTPKTAKKVTDVRRIANAPRVTDRDRAVYVISVAAELAGVHPQTLRMYERKGLLQPARTEGRARRYSERDIEHVRLIQMLTQEYGINLAGVEMVMSLQRSVEEMSDRLEAMRVEAETLRAQITHRIGDR